MIIVQLVVTLVRITQQNSDNGSICRIVKDITKVQVESPIPPIGFTNPCIKQILAHLLCNLELRNEVVKDIRIQKKTSGLPRYLAYQWIRRSRTVLKNINEIVCC